MTGVGGRAQYAEFTLDGRGRSMIHSSQNELTRTSSLRNVLHVRGSAAPRHDTLDIKHLAAISVASSGRAAP